MKGVEELSEKDVECEQDRMLDGNRMFEETIFFKVGFPTSKLVFLSPQNQK